MRYNIAILFFALSFSLFLTNCAKSDEDGDGFTTEEGDCSDNNANIYPVVIK